MVESIDVRWARVAGDMNPGRGAGLLHLEVDRLVRIRLDLVVSVAHDVVVHPGGDHEDQVGPVRGAQYPADGFRIAQPAAHDQRRAVPSVVAVQESGVDGDPQLKRSVRIGGAVCPESIRQAGYEPSEQSYRCG